MIPGYKRIEQKETPSAVLELTSDDANFSGRSHVFQVTADDADLHG